MEQKNEFLKTYSKEQNCGADQDRTDDLLNAIQALSQLSYGPNILYYYVY